MDRLPFLMVSISGQGSRVPRLLVEEGLDEVEHLSLMAVYSLTLRRLQLTRLMAFKPSLLPVAQSLKQGYDQKGA